LDCLINTIMEAITVFLSSVVVSILHSQNQRRLRPYASPATSTAGRVPEGSVRDSSGSSSHSTARAAIMSDENIDEYHKSTNNPNQVFKFVITGGPCSGKTTVMERLQNFLRERGIQI
jgi:hypothetical protein